MRKAYESPELDVIQFKLTNVLNLSNDETITGGGTIVEPGDDLIEDDGL